MPSTDVLIVGAGPVGLMLAGELQRRGIRHLLVEQQPESSYFSKALGITPRTLEVWDQIGVLEAALSRGRFSLCARRLLKPLVECQPSLHL